MLFFLMAIKFMLCLSPPKPVLLHNRSRPVSRPASRAGSLLDPLSDAEALAAAQAAAQSQAGPDSTSTSPARPDSSDGADAQDKAAEALGNEQMVWEMLYNPDYSLPTADAVSAWHRAMGKEVVDEEVRPHTGLARCCGA
jgi:hypothetical protein